MLGLKVNHVSKKGSLLFDWGVRIPVFLCNDFETYHSAHLEAYSLPQHFNGDCALPIRGAKFVWPMKYVSGFILRHL